MALRIVQLGTPRHPKEGLRLGTVRRPPRGVPKAEFASRNYYDVRLPILSPSESLVKEARPEAQHTLVLLAALSKTTHLSVGCYRDEEARCHRSVLRELLIAHGAELA